MLGAFVLGILAGAGAQPAEPHIKRALEGAIMAEASLDDAQWRAVSLAVCLFVAAILVWLLTHGGAVALTLGAVAGLFGPYIMQFLKRR